MTWQKFNSVACYRCRIDVGIPELWPWRKQWQNRGLHHVCTGSWPRPDSRSNFKDGEISFVRRGGGAKMVTYMPVYDQKLLDDLINQNVKVQGTPPEEQSLLGTIFISWFPMILLIGVDFLHASNARRRR